MWWSRSLLHAPYWNLLDRTCVTHRVMESVASFGGSGVSLQHPVLQSVSAFGGWEVSLTSPVLETV